MSRRLGRGANRPPERRPRYSIRLKAMLSAVGVLVSMAALLGWWLQGIDWDQRLAAHRDRIQGSLESLSRSQTGAFQTGNRTQLNQALENLCDDRGIVFYAAIDASGRILDKNLGPEFFGAYAHLIREQAVEGPPPSSAPPPGADEEPALVAERSDLPIRFFQDRVKDIDDSIRAYAKSLDASVFDGLIPGDDLIVSHERVLAPGNSRVRPVIGMLMIGHDTSYLNIEHTLVRSKIWIVIAIVTTITALVVWVLTHFFIQPIYRVIEATQAIAEDCFDRKVEVNTQDELRLLADSVNVMSEKLRQSRETIAAYNRELEEKVRQRTEKLQLAYEELKVLDGMKDGFLSSISHEIRTPISSVKAFSEILLHTPDIAADEREEFHQIIHGESLRLETLVNKMFELVRLESGEMPFEFAPTTPMLPLQDALAAVHESMQAKQLELCLDAGASSPSSFWDRSMVARILQEILANAVEFSAPGGRVHVSTEDDEAAESCVYRVRDEGPGIPAEALEGVFEKFRQIGGTLTDKPQGTGLGLPVCRRIAAGHGGTVHAEQPEQGTGAALVVRLPWRPEAALASAVEPRALEEDEDLDAVSLAGEPSPADALPDPPDFAEVEDSSIEELL